MLHLGAGAYTHTGWIGSDILPGSKQIVWLDATKAFPIDSQSFDYILCEHMIEHIPWESALNMLTECHRVLRPGGVVRIATPDLSVLFDLYHKPPTPAGQNYLKWIVDHYIAREDSYKPIFVVNNAFRNWGHQFLFDEDALRAILTSAGFTDIVRCRMHESQHTPLQGVECHGRNIGNEEISRFETMIFEARRD